MAKERLKSPRARLFIAIDIPEEVRAGLRSWGARALADPALRPVRPESLHITLAFLGYRPEKDIDRLAEIVAGGGAQAPEVELRDPVARPSARRARLYALLAPSAGVDEIQAGLQDALVADGLYKPEKRPFWSHLTVARVRPEGRGSKRPMGVARPPSGLPAGLCEPFFSRRLTLYRSELQPQGARYTPLAQVELPTAGRQ